jgi:hypothetical protein
MIRHGLSTSGTRTTALRAMPLLASPPKIIGDTASPCDTLLSESRKKSRRSGHRAPCWPIPERGSGIIEATLKAKSP